MKKNLVLLLLCFLMLAGAITGAAQSGSSKSGNSASANKNPEVNAATEKPTREAAKKTKADACALLTSADVQTVQADAVQETKPSVQPGGGLTMSQCLFRTVTASKSVSIAVAAESSISPRTFWKKQFHSAKTEADDKDKKEKKPVAGRREENEEEDESTRPRAIAGVGEEAYWVGGPMVGALYVLQGNTFLRISVGGVREESARIEKSVALARIALKHL
jgi:Ni/Co efflux regulator RcnB